MICVLSYNQSYENKHPVNALLIWHCFVHGHIFVSCVKCIIGRNLFANNGVYRGGSYAGSPHPEAKGMWQTAAHSKSIGCVMHGHVGFSSRWNALCSHSLLRIIESDPELGTPSKFPNKSLLLGKLTGFNKSPTNKQLDLSKTITGTTATPMRVSQYASSGGEWTRVRLDSL